MHTLSISPHSKLAQCNFTAQARGLHGGGMVRGSSNYEYIVSEIQEGMS